MKCFIKGCRGDLYNVDRRYTGRYENQQIVRYYCCVDCGARFKSLEVLNPIPHSFKPLSEKFMKKRFGV